MLRAVRFSLRFSFELGNCSYTEKHSNICIFNTSDNEKEKNMVLEDLKSAAMILCHSGGWIVISTIFYAVTRCFTSQWFLLSAGQDKEGGWWITGLELFLMEMEWNRDVIAPLLSPFFSRNRGEDLECLWSVAWKQNLVFWWRLVWHFCGASFGAQCFDKCFSALCTASLNRKARLYCCFHSFCEDSELDMAEENISMYI